MENWTPILGFEDTYAISDLGRIKRTRAATGTRIGKLVKPYLSTAGYQQVALCVERKISRHYVHRLVMLSFTQERAQTVNHKNGIRADNRLQNLEWLSNSENIKHGYRVLRHRIGAGHWAAKLTDETVRKARRLAKSGWTHDKIASKFRLSRPSVSKMLKGLTWHHVTD